MAEAICWPPAVDFSFPSETERPPGPLRVTADPLGTEVSEKARVSVDGDPGTIDPGAGAEVTSSGWAAATAGPAHNAPSTTVNVTAKRRGDI
jgi:hypothetical protein